MWPIFYYWGIDRFGPRNHKLARNVVSWTHSISTVVLFFTVPSHLKGECMAINTTSYFLWDLFYMYTFRIEPMYIFHHLTCTWFLWSNAAWYYKIMALFYGELSNVPTYLVYHRIKLDIPCRSLKIFQLGWFSFFRTYEMGKLLIHYWKGDFSSWVIFKLYMLGNYWAFKQFKKLYSINK